MDGGEGGRGGGVGVRGLSRHLAEGDAGHEARGPLLAGVGGPLRRPRAAGRLGAGADLQAAGRCDARLRHGAAEARLPRDPASAARACAAGGPRPLGRRSADDGAGDVLRR